MARGDQGRIHVSASNLITSIGRVAVMDPESNLITLLI